jgi:hypothetical protein
MQKRVKKKQATIPIFLYMPYLSIIKTFATKNYYKNSMQAGGNRNKKQLY